MVNPFAEKQARINNIYSLIIWMVILLIILVLVRGNAFGQYQKPPPKITVLLKNWSLNVNGGKTSFYGEVSLYDDEFAKKISSEGAWGYGLVLSRQMTPIFGLSGQLLFCSLQGTNSSSRFKADIMEYSINTTINIVNMLMPGNNANFFVYGKMGLGQFEFKSKLVYNDIDKDDKLTESESPEFLFLIGGGLYYRISNSFDINAEMAARLINNDYVDGSSNNKDDKDYYTYLSLGVTYKINNRPRDTRYYKRMGMKSHLIRRR